MTHAKAAAKVRLQEQRTPGRHARRSFPPRLLVVVLLGLIGIVVLLRRRILLPIGIVVLLRRRILLLIGIAVGVRNPIAILIVRAFGAGLLRSGLSISVARLSCVAGRVCVAWIVDVAGVRIVVAGTVGVPVRSTEAQVDPTPGVSAIAGPPIVTGCDVAAAVVAITRVSASTGIRSATRVCAGACEAASSGVIAAPRIAARAGTSATT